LKNLKFVSTTIKNKISFAFTTLKILPSAFKKDLHFLSILRQSKKSMSASSRTICDELEYLTDESHGDSVSISEILHRLRERGFGMLMLFFVLPNCVPIPVPPGTSTILSVPLLFLTLQMVRGRSQPWVPEKIAKKRIKMNYLRAVVKRILPPLRMVQKLVKPRFAVAASKNGERFVGFCWLLFAISIAIPLPMTNFLPGMGILISAFGLIGRDGYIMCLGFLVGIFGLCVTTGVLLLGATAIKGMISWLI
jgi:hypothetical protein